MFSVPVKNSTTEEPDANHLGKIQIWAWVIVFAWNCARKLEDFILKTYWSPKILTLQERADIKKMFEDDAEEDERFIASDSESEAEETPSSNSNSDSEEEVIVKKRKVTTRGGRGKGGDDNEKLSKGKICQCVVRTKEFSDP